MNKLFKSVLALTTILSLAACGSSSSASTSTDTATAEATASSTESSETHATGLIGKADVDLSNADGVLKE